MADVGVVLACTMVVVVAGVAVVAAVAIAAVVAVLVAVAVVVAVPSQSLASPRSLHLVAVGGRAGSLLRQSRWGRRC